jgi:hypothetical protein
MRKFASCTVLTKVFRYASLLAPMDPCSRWIHAIVLADLAHCCVRFLQRGLMQMNPSAVEA